MKLAILLATRNRPERVAALVDFLRSNVRVPHDLIVAQAGAEGSPVGAHTTLWYRDDDFRGKAFGHSLALQHARLCGEYDYVWILSSDLEFEAGVDCAQALIALLEREPRMAIAVPTVRSRTSLGMDCTAWNKIATCESLGFVMRMTAIDEVGFLDPAFQYGWGAMDELAHRLYCRGWFLARASGVGCHYLPASTQGHDLPFDEYWRRARRFAFDYFRQRYGEHWDELFWSALQGQGTLINAYREHKRIWAGAFSPAELLERSGGDVAPAIAAALPADETPLLARAEAGATEPWPLASDAAYRVLAWPDYGDERELEQLFDEFARVLVGRSDVCLCLRFDESIDGPEELVIERVQRMHERTLGSAAPLEVLVVDDSLAPLDLPRLGAAVIGNCELPSAAREPRRAFFAATQTLRMEHAEALRARLEQWSHPRYAHETLEGVDFALVRAIGDLHPWAAPAVFGNLAVRPGHGTNRPAAVIAKLAERRSRAIVAPITLNFELEGARVLELGSGFGLCSAELVACGAKHVVLVEQRAREQRQANLYWTANAFLPRENWRVLTNQLALDSTWDEIARLGTFDVVLWTEALAHGEQVALRVLQLARSTARVLVLDLSDPEEPCVASELEERLVNALRAQGFDLEVKHWTPPGQSTDEHALRTVLFAVKSKLIHVTAAALPTRAPRGAETTAVKSPHAEKAHD